jgi:hypothetical protein
MMLFIHDVVRRQFWVKYREWSKAVYACCDDWPNCRFPELKPATGYTLLSQIENIYLVLCSRLTLSNVFFIPYLQWRCAENWRQLEMATRNLALHVEFIFETYNPCLFVSCTEPSSNLNEAC